MSWQPERIRAVCETLGLGWIASQCDVLAQTAAKAESSYTDCLEQCLRAEQQARQQRSRTVLVKMARLPLAQAAG
ncbi:MAG: ATP-binding protein [Sedimenticolaceae bacterium]|jgi:DNA replication protein DnaC